MKTKRTITFLAVALLSMAQSGPARAQGKKGGSSAVLNKATQLMQAGAMDAAIAEYTLAIENNPKDARIYNERGGAYLALKKFAEAANDFSKAIELVPKDYAGYSNRGAALSEQNQLDAALADLNKALELK